MYLIRDADERDAVVISDQRRRMFVDMGHADDSAMQAMVDAFVPWVRQRLADGRYVGWQTVEDGRVVAGAGMLLMDFPPHWRDTQPIRAYLLNFYVDPAVRGRGFAFTLLKKAVVEARSRGIRVISLHASAAGRLLYERNGFEPTNEMMLMVTDAE